ncbi:MAG: hypothetical protein H5U40_00400 [Polyangiaceae bacterium]|nr:hypothetical protein [Polyangiaceae bacterium]
MRAREAEIRFRLRSLRSAALAAYRDLAEPWLTSPLAWQNTTNAKAATLSPESSRRAAEALAREVDRIYYGADVADAADIERIARAVDEHRNNAAPSRRTR